MIQGTDSIARLAAPGIRAGMVPRASINGRLGAGMIPNGIFDAA
jgi:hypothetical protein